MIIITEGEMAHRGGTPSLPFLEQVKRRFFDPTDSNSCLTDVKIFFKLMSLTWWFDTVRHRLDIRFSHGRSPSKGESRAATVAWR